MCIYQLVPRTMAVYIVVLLLWVTSPWSTLALPGVPYGPDVSGEACRTMPGDPDWPSNREWAQLNSSVNGRLMFATPMASVCHDPNFTGETCEALKRTWNFPDPQ